MMPQHPWSDPLTMQPDFQAAAIQLNTNGSRDQNVAKAIAMVEHAARQGARLVVLPELFNGYGDMPAVIAGAETIPGPTSEQLRAVAMEHGIWLLAGSICERSSQPDRGYNTALLFAPDGTLAAKYRKLHLFDANVPGGSNMCESQHMLPGDQPLATATQLGAMGIGICYDLRFPEFFRSLSRQGMEVLLLPSAFTSATGKDHWHILVRARAIENQCYVIAANQCGRHSEKLTSFGHSLIVDPWGRIVAEAGDEEGVIVARLDGVRLNSIREVLPVLKNRKL